MPVNPSVVQSADKLGEQVRMLHEHVWELRVRYQETDGQGRVHHSIYPNYFEIARVEMLRSSGVNYGDLERAGLRLVVARLEIEYLRGAQFDDLLTIRTRVARVRGTRLDHHYVIETGGEPVVMGQTTVAAVDQEGKATRLPAWLRQERSEPASHTSS